MKLVRTIHSLLIPDSEKDVISDPAELNKLYALKIQEELSEIQQADHSDIMEFADLIEAAYSFARLNGFSRDAMNKAIVQKSIVKGSFGAIVLTELNPENASNSIYFREHYLNSINNQ